MVEPAGMSGICHYVYSLCNALCKRGNNVQLLTATKYELENYSISFRIEKLFNICTLFDSHQYKVVKIGFGSLKLSISTYSCNFIQNWPNLMQNVAFWLQIAHDMSNFHRCV